MAIGDPDYDPNDPLNYAQRTQPKLPRKASFLPAANKFSLPQNTAFSRNAPVNTLAQNSLSKIPIGGFGLGALQNVGYSRSPQTNFSDFLNQGTTSQQPSMTGFHWHAGTGGVSGGNNDVMRQFYSDGTTKSFTGGVQDNKPLAPTQYTLPGVNADVRALSDPSVGALEGAQRYSQNSQQIVNPIGGGQIISGAGPSYGSLQGSTPAADAYNRPGLNTPSGGQAFAGPSLRKPMDKLTAGQTWLGGGNWY